MKRKSCMRKCLIVFYSLKKIRSSYVIIATLLEYLCGSRMTLQYNTIQYNITHVPFTSMSVSNLPPLLPGLTAPVSGIKMAAIHAPWVTTAERSFGLLRRGQLPVEWCPRSSRPPGRLNWGDLMLTYHWSE